MNPNQCQRFTVNGGPVQVWHHPSGCTCSVTAAARTPSPAPAATNCPNCRSTNVVYRPLLAAYVCSSCGWMVSATAAPASWAPFATPVPAPVPAAPAYVVTVTPGRYPVTEGTLYRGALIVEDATGRRVGAGTYDDPFAYEYRCRWAGGTARFPVGAVELGRMGVATTRTEGGS